MSERNALIFEFIRRFCRYAYHLREILLISLVLIALGGIVVAKLEGISTGDGIYYAFITGLTIGYGDIAAATAWGRVFSVAIGLIGTLFAGLIVAVASRALHDTLQQFDKVSS